MTVSSQSAGMVLDKQEDAALARIADTHPRPSAGVRVVMLVNNSCLHDSRVIREAETLAGAGYDVTVLARQLPDLPRVEVRNGVTYRRFAGVTERWQPSARRWARLVDWLRDPHRSTFFRKGLARSVLALGPWLEGVIRTEAAPASGGSTRGGSMARSRHAISAARAAIAALPVYKRIRIFAIPVLRRVPTVAKLLRGTVALASYLVVSAGAAIVFLLDWKFIKNFSILVLRLAVNKAKRPLGSALIFEDVDAAMRRELLRSKPHIIHAHDLMTLPAASMAAEDLGAKLVYDSHELELHRNATYPKLTWMRYARLEKRHIRRADLVITVSDSIADHLRDEYRIPRPTVVLNAPSLSKPGPAEDTVKARLGLGPADPLAIYVGAVTINRGLETCVKALASFPELNFATIGPRRPATENSLIPLAAAEGVRDRLHLIDPVAPDAVVSFISDADVSVLPIQNVCLSYYYCMPNKLFESVLAALPVAVADLVELRRFVERYGCGAVMDETDPRDVARTIREVYENRENYILHGGVLEEVRSTYSWPAQAALLVNAYSRLSHPVETSN